MSFVVPHTGGFDSVCAHDTVSTRRIYEDINTDLHCIVCVLVGMVGIKNISIVNFTKFNYQLTKFKKNIF